jgi:hypothetical protein
VLATIAGRSETFSFDKLAEARNVAKRIAGATVTLENIRRVSEGWEVRLGVRYDEAGDALASHRQWIFDNPASLKNSDGTSIAYESFETTAQGDNMLGVAFRFRTDRPIEDYSFVYQTPGTIVTRSFQYELKDIPLP